MPCGRCRQLLFEHGGPEMLVAAEGGPITVAELLPHAFGPKDLAALANKAARGQAVLGAVTELRSAGWRSVRPR